ncbi:MAG: hypothetical protein BGO67_11725 [Alphaproteobacteria bacterium 41-28]|nr:MAG: hypothetical protein BGO67_11725 [Alphaproteobacteria bacterium 41-28]
MKSIILASMALFLGLTSIGHASGIKMSIKGPALSNEEAEHVNNTAGSFFLLTLGYGQKIPLTNSHLDLKDYDVIARDKANNKTRAFLI